MTIVGFWIDLRILRILYLSAAILNYFKNLYTFMHFCMDNVRFKCYVILLGRKISKKNQTEIDIL